MIRKCHVIEDPSAVCIRDLIRGEGDDFRHFVGVQFGERLLESWEDGAGGFENGENFGGGFDFSLPAVDRFHSGDEIDARCELPFHKGCANLTRLFRLGECAKD